MESKPPNRAIIMHSMKLKCALSSILLKFTPLNRDAPRTRRGRGIKLINSLHPLDLLALDEENARAGHQRVLVRRREARGASARSEDLKEEARSKIKHQTSNAKECSDKYFSMDTQKNKHPSFE